MNKNIKKGCLISLLVFLTLLILAGVVILWVISQSYGLTKAPHIPLPDKFPSNATCKATLRIEPHLKNIERIIPWDELGAKLQIPGLQSIIPLVLPYEIGIWSITDMPSKSININIAVSEKRLGPIIYEVLQSESPWLNVKQIKWNPQGLEYTNRGLILLKGTLPIPQGLEETVSKEWIHPEKAVSVNISPNSKELFEITLDFHSGDIYVWTSAITSALGISLEEEKEKNQYIKLGMDIAKKLKFLYASVVPKKEDELEVNIELFATPESRGALEFFIGGLGLPFAQEYLIKNYGIKLEGKLNWDESKNALTGRLYLRNYENFLKAKLKSAIS
ncbi:MAG: hypothetical protein N3G21_08840 [Candidatus Hydrogenedentes bacterium]|nr:hypothetical protein [Candidatus Hydrogenedentota bacterium]